MSDLDILDECVRRADAQKMPTRQEMWLEAVRIYKMWTNTSISVSTVRRCTRIVPETPLGRRGGKKHEGYIPRSIYPEAAVQALRASVPVEFQHLVDRQAAGSLVAATRLKCLECSGWNKSEACRCEDMGCPLWLLRRKFTKNLAVV